MQHWRFDIADLERSELYSDALANSVEPNGTLLFIFQTFRWHKAISELEHSDILI